MTSFSNSMTRDQLDAEFAVLGGQYGQGANSRPAAALLALEAATKLDNIGPDQAAELYEKFQRAASASKGIEYKVDASQKVQVSKLKQFLTLGNIKAIDGYGLMDEACDLIRELSQRDDNALKGSAYDNMVLIARRQIKRYEENGSQLTTDELRGILTEVTPEKTDVDKVIDLYKRAHKLADHLTEGGVNTDAINIAIDALADQITQMDGTLPAITKAEREKERAINTLQKHGMAAVVMRTGVAQ